MPGKCVDVLLYSPDNIVIVIVIVMGNRYAELPDAMHQHGTFGFGLDRFGYPQQSVRFAWAALNNERVTLSFKPATQADEDALRSLLPDGEITDISQLPTTIPGS